MALIKYPYTNLHELNLDWIIEQLNQSGAVLSVNGKHGAVTLTGEDINRTSNSSETIAQALTTQGNSIQSVQTKIGVTALPTTAQTITGAIAEHETDITNINNKIGSTALPTTAQTLTGAAAELDGDVTTINNKIGNTALPTTAQTLTGAIAEHETDISGISSSVNTLNTRTARQNIGVTLNNIGNTYFTHSATHGSLVNGIYCVTFNVTTTTELPTSELNIGSVSFNPQWTVVGYIVVNNSSAFAGTVQVTSSGAIYIRATETIPTNRDLIITAIGAYY